LQRRLQGVFVFRLHVTSAFIFVKRLNTPAEISIVIRTCITAMQIICAAINGNFSAGASHIIMTAKPFHFSVFSKDKHPWTSSHAMVQKTIHRK